MNEHLTGKIEPLAPRCFTTGYFCSAITSLMVIGILLQSTAWYNVDKQHRPWLVINNNYGDIYSAIPQFTWAHDTLHGSTYIEVILTP